MASKTRKIRKEEWETHKAMIRNLYSHTSLAKMILDMERLHGFIASKSQYEAQLRSWNIRKNLKRTEWEAHFHGSEDLQTLHARTSYSRSRNRKSVQRARRYITQMSSFESTDVVHDVDMAEAELNAGADDITCQTAKHQYHHVNGPGSNGFSPSHWTSLDTTRITSNGDSLSSLPSPCGFSQISPNDYWINFMQDMGIAPSLADMEIVQGDADGSWSPTLPTSDNKLTCIWDSFLTSTNAQMASSLPLVPKDLLNTLPFFMFEAYLETHGIKLSAHTGLVQVFFSQLTFGNSHPTSKLPIGQEIGKLKVAKQITSLLPGYKTSGSLIAKDQITATAIIRTCLFSALNGFARLNDIPMGDILSVLGRLDIVTSSFIRLLRDGPKHTSRTLAGNLFRAAVEKKDVKVVQLLLENRLVDVNETVCMHNGSRYTPVERAAYHHDLETIRLLVEHGAEVNNTFGSGPHHGGALECFLDVPAGTTSRSEMLGTVDYLITSGSVVYPRYLSMDTTNGLAPSLCRAIQAEEHHFFFHDYGPYGFANNFVVKIAATLGAQSSFEVIDRMITLCKDFHGGDCMLQAQEALEIAAMRAALDAKTELLEFLIQHIPSLTGVFCFAIRSTRSDVIAIVLSHRPDLDPAPFHLNRKDARHFGPGFSDAAGRTTPLIEAVRVGNYEMTAHIEDAGAFASHCADTKLLQILIAAAAEAGNIEYVKRLLLEASSTKRQCRIPDTAVQSALDNDHAEIAELLIAEGASCSGLNLPMNATSTIGIALEKRNLNIVRALLGSEVDEVTAADINAALKWCESEVIDDLSFAIPDMYSIHKSRMSLPKFCLRCMEKNRIPLFRHVVEQFGFDTTLSNQCLAAAISRGNLEMANYLLQMGANALDAEVLRAAILNSTEMLSFLLKQNERGQRPAPIAKSIGISTLLILMEERPSNASILDALLKTGAVDLSVPRSLDNNHILSGDPIVSRLAKPRNLPLADLLTPLGLAILGIPGYCSTNISAIKQFIAAGSDPNGVAKVNRLPRHCLTALMLAIDTGREDVVNLLLDSGADINRQPHLTLKRTPLQHAAMLGDLHVVNLLIGRGADVNANPATHGGGTALQFAAIAGNCNIVVELLEQGARLGALPPKVHGRWPLEGAAENGRLDMIQYLWNMKEMSPYNWGFEERQCLRAMHFARGMDI